MFVLPAADMDAQPKALEIHSSPSAELHSLPEDP